MKTVERKYCFIAIKPVRVFGSTEAVAMWVYSN